jgi:hypothetical protein
VACLALSGCTRAYYRRQADGEAYNLLGHGIRDPRWHLNRLSIDPDPRARFYDPDCPDHPPMPSDDPTSHQMMHCVDCKAGYPCWHCQGDKPFVENPDFRNYLPYDAQGTVVLNREGSVQLALVNSPVYQNNLEELYLSALEVSQQRFEFDMQFFLRDQTFFTALGRRAPNTGGQSRSILTTGPVPGAGQLGAERLFSTGGLLTADLANSFMWQFSGPNSESVNTLLSAAFVQPLLRNAGRDFFLEGLTLQERLLLANIRAMQRYRQGFYLQVVAGVQAPPGPQRGGSGFGGAAAGFFGVAGLAATAGGGGGGGGGAGVGAPQAGGYLGLLQDARQIANLRSNVAGLRRSLELLEALFEANRIDRLQVDQARQTLFNQQSLLLTTEANYQLALDNFKNTLGMPPCLPIKIEDPLLDQFELLGPDMVALQNDAGAMLARLAAPANGNAARGGPPVPLEGQEQLERDLELLRQAAEMLRVSQSLVPPGANHLQALRDRFRIYEGRLEELLIQGNDLRRATQQLRSYPAAVELAKALQQSAQQEVPDVEASLELLRTRAEDRVESLQDLATREEVTAGKVDLRAFDIEAFRKRLADLPAEYAQIDRHLSAPLDRWDNRRRQLESQQAALNNLLARFAQLLTPLRAAVDPLKEDLAKPGVLTLPPGAQRFLDELNRLVDDPQGDLQRFAADMRQVRDLLDAVFQEANALSQDAYGLGLVQARARLEATRLIPIDLDQCTAMRVARENRLDLMNARAGLVDAWRLIQVRGDALKAGLDVVFDGQINTLGDNPFRFRSPTGQLRAGLRWDTPITRLQERNIYRQELIRFQRARRSFINFNDTIDRSLRNFLRTIELNQVNFELRRAAVHLAIEQVELASLRLQEPPRPGVVTEGLGNTTARDLIDSLNALLTAQNAYLGVFVNYEQLRMQLDLDLGTMLLDDQGMWIDPGEISDNDFGGCAEDSPGGTPEGIPVPPGDPTSVELTPLDISTLILLPSDEELDANQEAPPYQLPQPATAASKRALPEPRRLDAAAIESAKAVQPAESRWALPLPASGWKAAKPVSGQ